MRHCFFHHDNFEVSKAEYAAILIEYATYTDLTAGAVLFFGYAVKRCLPSHFHRHHADLALRTARAHHITFEKSGVVRAAGAALQNKLFSA